MLNLYCKIKAFWDTRDRGASAVEYALLLAAIIAVVAGLIWAIGAATQAHFQNACDSIGNCDGGGGAGG